jgi:hypothetical protein
MRVPGRVYCGLPRADDASSTEVQIDLMDERPTSQVHTLWQRLLLLGRAAVLIAGCVSLLTFPLPTAVLITVVGLGAFAELVVVVFGKSTAVRAIALVLVLLGLEAFTAAQRLAPELRWPWWQPLTVMLGAMFVVELLAIAIRYFNRRRGGAVASNSVLDVLAGDSGEDARVSIRPSSHRGRR